VFEEMGIVLVSMSINHFQPIQDVEELFQIEKGLHEMGVYYLEKREYFSGFFMHSERKDSFIGV